MPVATKARFPSDATHCTPLTQVAEKWGFGPNLPCFRRILDIEITVHNGVPKFFTIEQCVTLLKEVLKDENPNYEEAIPKANKAWKKLAADRNAELRRMVAEVMEKTGLTKLVEVAHALNLRGVKTNRGCQFTATQVHRLLKAA